MLEKVIYSQLYSHLNTFIILDTFQSGFRTRYCTESVLLKVTNDIIISGPRVYMLFLDLNDAFDTIDHEVLLNRFECRVGVEGTA
ncbi:hypothetical protein, partial [Serratia marcescens]|uniref:hypothetical protein n=1 Tax=Serratia marcescens TaxID=615 RepID=UPI0035943CE9